MFPGCVILSIGRDPTMIRFTKKIIAGVVQAWDATKLLNVIF
jgi:hypothetical protein